MKKILLVLGTSLLLASCSVGTSKISESDIDPDDVTYFKDNRTGLCFGILASKKAQSMSSTGLGIACVPCEALKNVKVIKD